MKAYIGIDTGKVNIKTVVINGKGDIIYKIAIPNNKLIYNIKYIFRKIKENIPKEYQIYNIGVTGDNRFIIGKFLSTEVIKTEIESIKEYCIFKKIEGNILEISSDNYKVLKIENKKLLDYKINRSSNMITNSFIYKISKQLRIKNIKYTKKNIQFKNDNLILLYEEIIGLSNKIDKNIIMSSLVKKMKDNLPQYDYIIDNDSNYAIAYGVSLIAKESKSNRIYDLNIENNTIDRKIEVCHKCNMHCEIVSIYRNYELVDVFGYRCNEGKINEYNKEVYYM